MKLKYLVIIFLINLSFKEYLLFFKGNSFSTIKIIKTKITRDDKIEIKYIKDNIIDSSLIRPSLILNLKKDKTLSISWYQLNEFKPLNNYLDLINVVCVLLLLFNYKKIK